jgi:hypothetical protein
MYDRKDNITGNASTIMPELNINSRIIYRRILTNNYNVDVQEDQMDRLCRQFGDDTAIQLTAGKIKPCPGDIDRATRNPLGRVCSFISARPESPVLSAASPYL